MALFTPLFKRNLETLTKLCDKRPGAAENLLEGLLGKTGDALQAELEKIFKRIAGELRIKQQFNDKAWGKLNEILNHIAVFDGAFAIELHKIRKSNMYNHQKEEALLKLLESHQFAALCANQMKFSSKRQIEDIVKRGTETLGATAEARAQQQSYSEWGQIGVMLVELFSQLTDIMRLQRGYDVNEPEEVEGGRNRTHFLPGKK